ncbi:hypothetical protein CSTERTH_10330 [Thermoclostridium stercorarium subsp. thermolacticum DSM 2910]|nr:hypothetical protein CSTERTH_10330 [Thermoclostridium stercorarium subsp. thermolacticum DSM 2910]
MYFIPIPSRINVTLQAFQLTDRFTGNSTNLSVKGWYLNYLFRPDELKGTLTITPYDFEKNDEAVCKFYGIIYELPDRNDVQFSSMIRYSEAKDSLMFGTMNFTKNFDKVVIEDDNTVYVASTETDYEPYQILNHFKGLIDKKYFEN